MWFLNKPYRLYLKGDIKFNYVSCGGWHTVMITKDSGQAYSTGLNSWSQLGIATLEDQFTPKLVESLESIKLTYASWGEEFTLFVSEKGKVYGCGLNNVGQCGFIGKEEDEIVYFPQQITALDNEFIESIVWGKGQAMAVNSRGVVFKWGVEVDDINKGTTPKTVTYFKNKEILHISSGREFFAILIAATDPKKWFATGKALNATIKAGHRTKFEIITIDKTGFMRISGTDRVNVFGINQVTGRIIDPKQIDVSDLNNGRYEVSLKVNQTGSYLIHVLVNGEEIQMSPFILHVKPGDPDPSKSYITFPPLNKLKNGSEPNYNLKAGETLFFNIAFWDSSGAVIDDLTELSESRIKIKKNGYEAEPKGINWKLILSEFGDHTIKSTFYIAETQRIEFYFDNKLLPIYKQTEDTINKQWDFVFLSKFFILLFF